MDVTAAFVTVAITVGSLTPGQAGPAPQLSVAPIAAALASSPAREQRVTDLPSLRRLAGVRQSTSRPSMLIPMYASLAALQGFDIYTTSAAIKRGAVEANPLVKPVAGRNMASVLVKAAATAGSIYFTERAWKSNRKGAVILMTAINVATAAIVAHNTQVARR
jgi:uncharacterized protein DUF5658